MLKQYAIALLITMSLSSCGSYYHYGKGKKQKVRVAIRKHSCYRGCNHQCN